MGMLVRRGTRGRLMIAAFGAAIPLFHIDPASAAERRLVIAQAQPNSSAPTPDQKDGGTTPAPVPPTAPSPAPVSTPAVAAPAPSAPADRGTPATVVDSNEVVGILGKPAKSPTGEDMGRLVDLIIDRSGQIRAAIVDFGGFLGVGSRKIAVDWRAVRFNGTGNADNLVLDLTRNQLRMAPAYVPGEPVVVIGPQQPEPKPVAAPTPEAAPATPEVAPPAPPKPPEP